jgi:putative two-component system response regulator
MAIIDVYDAVSSRRCYKEGRSHEEVVRIIRDLSWSKFDPMLVDSFLSVSDQFRRIFEENPDHSLISESSRGALAGPAVADPVGRL